MIKTSKTIVAGLLSVAFVVGAFASTVGAQGLSAQELALLQSLLARQTTSQPAQTASYTFTRDLSQGMSGEDVRNLQKVLNSNSATQVASSGAGSPGNESTFFGSRTTAAVKKYQANNGIVNTGFVGPKTRAALNSSAPVTTVPGTTVPGTTVPVPVAGGLTVVSAAQPTNSLAPQGAARVPFTKVTLTAGQSDVTVNSITVRKAGLIDNSAFAGVVLLNEDGMQIGIAKTLNSNYEAMVGEPFVVKAGTSRTLTIAGNMSSNLASQAGQVGGLNVVGVTTSATVAGSFPITGAVHTVNATLSLSNPTVAVSSFDPNTSSTKEVGTTNYKFAGLRVTAGSSEKVRIWSVRFNQSGSASSNDLANVVVVAQGVKYPTVVSTDGKYYSATFGSGIVLDKGLSTDIYVEGDVVGSGAAGRTVKFDIFRSTDIYLTGELYNYGLTPSPSSTGAASNSTSEFTTGTPWFDGSLVTVSAGSVTTISKSVSVPSQNIAINVPDQPLGGYEIDLKGEAISVQSQTFYFTTSAGASGNLLTNVKLVDSNGATVAGPVDATLVGGTNQKVVFTDTITYPLGKTGYRLLGKVPTTLTSGTLIASTTPSSDWSNITGQVTGNTISLSTLSSAVSMNTMTVKNGALVISVGSSPSAQTIVAGGSSRVFANINLDATASGENVRFSTLPLKYTYSGTAAHLSGCQLFDGSTALNTGSNTVNPTSANSSGSNVTFTFDQQFEVVKNSVKTLTLKCNVSSSATNASTFAWGLGSPTITVTGSTSSNSITPVVTASNGQTQTIGVGSFTVEKDAGQSPSYTVVAPGSSEVVLGIFKFNAANEEVNLRQLALQLSGVAASSTPAVLSGQIVKLYDGSTLVGTAVFTGQNRYATSTLSSDFRIPKDGSRTLTLKAALSPIGASLEGMQGALVQVDIDGNNSGDTEGTGGDSGTTIDSSTVADTAVDGVRVFRSYPTLAKDSVSSNKLANGSQSLLRFKVTANGSNSSDALALTKLSIKVATTTATVTNFNVFAYVDAYSTPVSGLSSGGQMMASDVSTITGGVVEVYAQTTGATQTSIQIPVGATRYFDVRGTVSGATTGASVQTQVEGDVAYPSLSTLMAQAASVDADANDDFIWSPNATTTSSLTHADWTNGYGLVGLPGSNMSPEVLSF